ncbi:hypothetical protein ACFSMW_06495 [Virgibacillus halophilus]|uniref:Lipoprotein n=1 Tax=Tigheibacillus halophilus TaxID=361280 RepID=A0ABU5C663_9BACI|nr:hypothetical protein [Virgibacillus halophilus]
MHQKMTILSIILCLAVLGGCSEKASTNGEGKLPVHNQSKMKTAAQEKGIYFKNAYAAVKPRKDAAKLQTHYTKAEKAEMPVHEAHGGEIKRSVPLGQVLLKGKKDTSNGPLKKNRLVAYYGTPLSENMGILGTMSPEKMMQKLKQQTQEWSDIDPERPSIPTIELIATVAQRSPGPEGLYITPPNDKVIKEYVELAKKHHALLLLDVQLGRADVMEAVKEVEQYLKLPFVHLAIDTEYSVGEGQVPGEDLGHVEGADIQEAVEYVDDMVKKYHLPDKMVLVHQFGNGIVRNKEAIHPTEHVEVPLNYDGFGDAAIKMSAYGKLVRQQPIQYGGFKLFTKNDKPMMTPKQVLQLDPAPVIINYQ